MNIDIRIMKDEDKKEVIDMMNVFYHSEAVLTDGSQEIYENDVKACLSDSPFAEGYVFESNGEIVGYGMLAKSFSTEFGKPCIWIEDIYIKENYRNKGIGNKFFEHIFQKYPEYLFRLEAERENKNAVKFYRKLGFEEIPYLELKK